MTATTAPSPASGWRTPLIVILAGCLIAMIGFGIRSIFGLLLEPMTVERGWDRETFGLAMAIQNLLWGLGVPIAGAIADRFGPARVLAFGAVVYAIGVWGMAGAESVTALHLFGGVLTGIGVAFTAFSLAMAAMAKVVGPERRSLALGLGTAAGSFGQVVFSPLGQGFIEAYGWNSALLIMAASTLIIIPLALALPNNTQGKGEPISNQSLGEALKEARGHRGFVLLTVGFFVCGFHVAFITVHFPSYIRDLGLDAAVGAVALALIGLFNIIGSVISGAAGQRWSKKCGLSSIYFLRAIVIAALLLAPKTELTIYLFAGAMGLLWLSTVPLTTGIVAQVFGVKYMATLFGLVFLSHQLGSFAGIWLGGYLYDTVGSYDGVWWAGVVLGLLATAIHLPIDEKPLARLAPAAA
ncbi:MAG: MFS transporter [Alphaproteobacteria bacterium]|nr:MFS transporter [Alphaproteobacteria bacterium]